MTGVFTISGLDHFWRTGRVDVDRQTFERDGALYRFAPAPGFPLPTHVLRIEIMEMKIEPARFA